MTNQDKRIGKLKHIFRLLSDAHDELLRAESAGLIKYTHKDSMRVLREHCVDKLRELYQDLDTAVES